MNERLLIIDDETNIRAMMRVALSHSGYQVSVAADGIEGLEIYGNGANFDLVLLDQRMPNMPGIEVQREIVRRNPDARVILITAFGTMDLALQALRAGAHDFLRKPFSAEVLRSSVRSALDRPTCQREESPVKAVCKAFHRSTINGYSFEFDSIVSEDGVRDLAFLYRVHSSTDLAKVTVYISMVVQELVKAYTDCEVLPGGEQFWQAMSEESLASHLWNEANIPAGNELRVEELSSHLIKWLDSIMTVNLAAA